MINNTQENAIHEAMVLVVYFSAPGQSYLSDHNSTGFMQISHSMTRLTFLEPIESNWSRAQQLAKHEVDIFPKDSLAICACIQNIDRSSLLVKWLVPYESPPRYSFA